MPQNENVPVASQTTESSQKKPPSQAELLKLVQEIQADQKKFASQELPSITEVQETVKNMVEEINQLTEKVKKIAQQENIPFKSAPSFEQLKIDLAEEKLGKEELEAKKTEESEGGEIDTEFVFETEDDEQISKFARPAADFTISKLKPGNDYQELNASSKKEGDKIFQQLTRELWKKFGVHGMDDYKTGGLKKTADLDGNTSIALLELAGFDIKDLEHIEKGSNIQQHPDRFDKGRLYADVGNQDGFEFDKDNDIAYIDHHAKESVRGTSATKFMYETLVGLGLLEEKPYLNKLVAFVNHNDNKTYPEPTGHYLRSDRTILGLERFMSVPNLIEFFKNNKNPNPTRELSDAELKQYGLEAGSKNQKGSIEKSMQGLQEMEKTGWIVESNYYGKIAVDLGHEKMVSGGHDASKEYGCGAYLNWNPKQKGFFISSLKPIREEFKQGKNVRQTMWIKGVKEDPSPLTLTLKEVLDAMTDGEFQPQGGLKTYISSGKSGRERPRNGRSQGRGSRSNRRSKERTKAA